MASPHSAERLAVLGLGKRLLVVVPGLLLATLAIAAGPSAFRAILAIGCGAAAGEFHAMTARGPDRWPRAVVPFLAMVVVWSLSGMYPPRPGLPLATALGGLLLLVLVGGWVVDLNATVSIRRAVALAIGTCGYLGALPATAGGLGHGPDGAAWLWAALAITWGGDIAAFGVGRAIGRHPLAPAISPRKTVEGAAASLVLGVGLGTSVLALAGTGVGFGQVLLLGAGNLAGQAGDLLESRLKRRAGSRHSGTLLGAQGGFLDTLDGLCLALPVLYIGRGLIG